MLILGCTSLSDGWNELKNSANQLISLLIAILFLVVTVLYLVSVVKRKPARIYELCAWLLLLVIQGVNLFGSFNIILSSTFYTTLGLTLLIIARIIYLIFMPKKGSSSKKR